MIFDFEDAFDILQRDGAYYEYCSDELKNNKEIVLVAIKEYPLITQWMPKHFFSDFDVIYQGIIGCDRYIHDPDDFYGFFIQQIKKVNNELLKPISSSDLKSFYKTKSLFEEENKRRILQADLSKLKKPDKQTRIKL